MYNRQIGRDGRHHTHICAQTQSKESTEKREKRDRGDDDRRTAHAHEISTKLRHDRAAVSSSRKSMKFVSGESKLSSVPRRVRPAPASTPELALWVLLPLFFDDGEDGLRVRFVVGWYAGTTTSSSSCRTSSSTGSSVSVPMWGRSVAWGNSSSRGFTAGSSGKTSNPTANSF